MRLTLTYRGPLHAQTNKDRRVEEKHAILREFHVQTKEVWQTHPSLAAMNEKLTWILDRAKAVPPVTNILAQSLADRPLGPGTSDRLWRQHAREVDDQNFIQFYDVGRFRFVPLINPRNWLACDLDILFLRREPAGHIVDNESGDIDNRIKVLFDALRMPRDHNELPASAQPVDEEKPFFCLLENDSLITGFRLESERLLYPATASDAEVQLTLRVTVKAIKITWGNLGIAD